jgi:hypothetical protein
VEDFMKIFIGRKYFAFIQFKSSGGTLFIFTLDSVCLSYFVFRVIYQNERYDDWLPRLAKIKRVLVNYKEDLVSYHKKKLPKAEADKMPNGTISSAANGNFLETLNLSSSGLYLVKHDKKNVLPFFLF